MQEKKYNIGTRLRSEYELTYKELCLEILYENKSGKEKSDDVIYKKINNTRGTGIVNHLNEKLGFKFEKVKKISNILEQEELFAWLKLVKLLYEYEKVGGIFDSNRKLEYLKHKIPIIDIMVEHCMKNVNTVQAPNSNFGNIFCVLEQQIAEEVCDSENRVDRFKAMQLEWLAVSRELMKYVITDYALKNSNTSFVELIKLRTTLEEKVMKLNNLEIDYTNSKEGVMPTFYNIIWSHNIKSIDNEQKNKKVKIDVKSDLMHYVSQYIEMEKKNLEISWNMLPILEIAVVEGNKNKLEGKVSEIWSDEEIRKDVIQMLYILKYLITYGEDIDKSERKYYRAAFKHCKTLVEWWYKRLSNRDIEEYIAWDCVVPAIQEIVYVYKNDMKIYVSHKGNKHPEKSMLSQLKVGKLADAIVKTVWINRVEYRAAYNFGMYNHLQVKEEIDNCFYRFKEHIFSFFDLNDIEIAHTVIMHYVKYRLKNEKVSQIQGVMMEDIERLGLGMFIEN